MTALFLYLPTLALCAVVLTGSAWLGYRIAIQALDNHVRGGAPVHDIDPVSWTPRAER